MLEISVFFEVSWMQRNRSLKNVAQKNARPLGAEAMELPGEIDTPSPISISSLQIEKSSLLLVGNFEYLPSSLAALN